MPRQELTLIYLEKVKQEKDAFRNQVELILALVFNHLTSKKRTVKMMACLPLSVLWTNFNVTVLLQILLESQMNWACFVKMQSLMI